jgi:sigma-54 dependent transcriptional regulator, acetoin dehydrogenase operon transcriptional activator AcoR
MRKKITLFVIEDKIGNYLTEELKYIFENTLEIDYLTPRMSYKPFIHETDLILYTDPSILIEMTQYIKCDAPILMMKRTISRQSIEKLLALDKGKSAYVFNINSFMSNETLADLYSLGIKNIRLFPFYPGLKPIKSVDYIITPNEFEDLPNLDSEIINIGNRLFEISTVLDIIAYLNVNRKLSEKIIKKYLPLVPTYWKGLKSTLYDKKMLSGQLDVVLNEFDNGVILCDETGLILLANSKASEILEVQKEFVQQDYLEHLIERNPYLKILATNEEIHDEIIDYKQKKLVVNVKKIIYEDVCFGKLISLKFYQDLLSTQQKLHAKLMGKGYYSKYTFSAIQGSHPKIAHVIKICKRIANSSSTVLLTGESGTGKELFAGSIHNYSDRKYKPFIAVNCAALPENLLESELFGYEEGSFTGALKGGKMGVFEKAHKGTLFLDEVGDLPINLQARLLRALQENEIMRIGGDSIIHVDVRIIAASNKNLFEMVKNGSFREDLFYRLNVFQIDLPPLREHKSDIPQLIQYFLNNFNCSRDIDHNFSQFCEKYDWMGNVRELRNTIEYMIHTSSDALKVENLPTHLKINEHLSTGCDEDLENFVMKIIQNRSDRGLGTGRRSIYEEFCKKHYVISEKKIRLAINRLNEKKIISVSVGRKGCQINKAHSISMT